MKSQILSFIFLSLTALTSFGEMKIIEQKGVIIIEGKYQNKNLYVQNSFSTSGVGFCVYEVTVNGKVTPAPVNSSAFEIDFRQEMIQPGTDVIVEIKYKNGCSPKILNPDALKPVPTFETLNISVDDNGIISWTTTNEMGSLPYVVEQYKWNKWIALGEVQGKGTPEKNIYSFRAPLISGENKFRVKQVGNNKKPRYSDETKLTKKISNVNYNYNKSKREIIFDSETNYEVYNKFGNLVKKGFGKNINCANLEKELHYMNYDNSTMEINIR